MSNIAREVIPINIEDELKQLVYGLRDERDHLALIRGRKRRPEAGPAANPGRDERPPPRARPPSTASPPRSRATPRVTTTRTASRSSTRPWSAWPRTSAPATRSIDGQGNMGSIDGDPPAAMRYTEMRMSPFAMEMLEDLDKDTVDWQRQLRPDPPGADGPARASSRTCSQTAPRGSASAWPPRFRRTTSASSATASLYLIDNPDATVDELMQFIKGPDFPTAGMILGTKGIRSAYETGRGQIDHAGRDQHRAHRGRQGRDRRHRAAVPGQQGTPASRRSRSLRARRRSTASPTSPTTPTATASASRSSCGATRTRRRS